jgi:DNA-directed RNA polymerase subunit RPC12/RpoP
MFFRNLYRCTRCGYEWSYVLTDRRNDDCSNCGARHMAPQRSEQAQLSHPEKIAAFNDQFRRTLSGGKVLMTAGVNELPDMVKAEAFCTIAAFSDFTSGNDPHGERDFGSFELCGRKLFWKIYYYGPDLQSGSEDPSDPAKTMRVMTIMLAEEY